MSSKSTSFVTSILALSAAGLLIFAGIGYTAGWIDVTDTEDQTTIEFDKSEASKDTQKAWEKSEQLIESARDSVMSDDKQEQPETPPADQQEPKPPTTEPAAEPATEPAAEPATEPAAEPTLPEAKDDRPTDESTPDNA